MTSSEETANPSLLPPSWRWARIEEIADTTSGGTPRRDRPRFYGGTIPWVKSGELKDGVVNQAEELITEEGLAASSAKVFPKGTVCIALYGATVGRLGILGIDASTNQAVCGIFPTSAVLPWFVFRYLQLIRQQLVQLGKGGAQPNISQSIVRQTRLPVAPLNEQRRILAEIEKEFTRLDAAVAALKRVQANLKRYRAATLKAACEGRLVPTEAELARREGRSYESASVLLERILAERRSLWGTARKSEYKEPTAPSTSNLPKLPEGWAWANWEQLSPRVTVGHVGPMKDEYVPEGFPFLRSQNVRENYFDAEGLLHISERFHRELAKSLICAGDLVVVRSGTVGTTCVVPDHLGESNCADLVIIKQPIHTNPWYGCYYMNSSAKSYVHAGKVGVALTHFNTKSVARLPVALPPKLEQDRIVAEVHRRLSVIDEIDSQAEADLRRASGLRQAVLKHAFTGQLVPQDPSDESASALLKRIRADRNADVAHTLNLSRGRRKKEAAHV